MSELLYEVVTDPARQRVWVNCSDGSCVGRFSVITGMDLHRAGSEQMVGTGECLDCTHEPPTAAEWERFRAGMVQHYGVDLAEDLIDFSNVPEWVARLRESLGS